MPSVLFILFIAVVSIVHLHAQWPGRLKDALKSAGDTVSLSKLTSGDPLSTGLKDVVFDVALLDDHNPAIRPISDLPAAPGGGWQLRSGSYGYVAQSFCLQTATHGPSRDGGDGYVYAPLKGPQAGTVRAILDNAGRLPDIPRQKIQLLLWGILSRTSFKDLPRDEQETAAQLLTPAQIAQLDRGALDSLSGEAVRRALNNAPAGVREVLEAQARMRDLFASGAGFADIENVAVLPGEPKAPASRIPAGRWSYHPGGYFIRYESKDYWKTAIQIDVPHAVAIETDSRGRIASLADEAEHRVLRLTYDDSIAPAPYPGASQVQAHRIQSVHYETPDESEPVTIVKGDWQDAIVFTGVPPNGKPRTTRLMGRYEFTREAMASTSRALSSLGRKPDDRTLARLANLVHVVAGMWLMLDQQKETRDSMYTQLDLVLDAWQYTFCQAAGDCTAADKLTMRRELMRPPAIPSAWSAAAMRRLSIRPRVWPSASRGWAPRLFAFQEGGGSSGSVTPGDGSATPGSEGSQRIGQSSRPDDDYYREHDVSLGHRQARHAAQVPWHGEPESGGGCAFPCW